MEPLKRGAKRLIAVLTELSISVFFNELLEFFTTSIFQLSPAKLDMVGKEPIYLINGIGFKTFKNGEQKAGINKLLAYFRTISIKNLLQTTKLLVVPIC